MRLTKIPIEFTNPVTLDKKLKKRPEKYWVNRGEQRALSLFQNMASRVPAYKDFLKKVKIDPEKIKSIKDFHLIPPTDKQSYLRNYPLEMLCWDGKLKEQRWTVATNTGSTGETFYFPREIEQDWQYACVAELYLRNNFDIQNRSTLYIDCFAMGAWIGGVFTYEALRLLSERGKYKLSVFTPGIFKEEILKAVRELGPKFDQLIIGGYPPLVKDIIDEGISKGIDWKKFKLGFVFSAEGFPEEFREHIFKKVGTTNYYKSSLNHYGTADMGTMAQETPLSVLVRRLAVNDKNIFNKLFKLGCTPTLTQYIPELFYFEEVSETLYCSGYSGLPLLRYDLKDTGGVYKYSDIEKIFDSEKLKLKDEIKKNDIKETIWNLPFVYVYERNDFTVKLYGANIFPETLRKIIHEDNFDEYLTGKFKMIIKFDKNQNQYLEINFELKSMAKPGNILESNLQKRIVEKLLKENSEYRSNYKGDPEKQIPKIVLRGYEDPEYFKPGIKQKWVDKN